MSKLVQLSEKEYQDFAQSRKDYTFLAGISAGKKMLDRAQKQEFVGLKKDGKIEAAAMLIYYPTAKVSNYVYIPRGPFLDWQDKELASEFFADLKDYLKSQNVLYAVINPYLSKWPLDQDGNRVEGETNLHVIETLKDNGFLEKVYDPAFEISFMSVLDIDGESMDSLLEKMDQQTRWSVRRALKYDLKLVNSKDPKYVEAFAKMMEHTGERRGFDGYDAAFYQSMLDHYGDDLDFWLCFLVPERLIASQQKLYDQAKADYEKAQEHMETRPSKKFEKKIKVAKEAMELAEKKMQEARDLKEKYGDEILIAGSMFISSNDEMVYLFSGAYKEFMSYNAPYAIHHAAISKALDEKKKVYNFYGILPHFKKGEEGYSLFAFKRGFGCKVVELVGNYILPVHGLQFSMYNKLKKIAQPIVLEDKEIIIKKA